MRWAALLFGISLVAVPALFDMFPEWTGISIWLRAAIVAGWIVVVAFTARSTLEQTERIEELVEPALTRREQQKVLAARRLLGLLLTRETGLPDHYTFRLYTFDLLRQELIPIYAPTTTAASWAVGEGVTGEAWRRGAYLVARGSEVSDGTYRLSPEKQRRYAHLQVVAAVPVLDDRERKIAILTGSSATDDGHLVSPSGFDRHQELAQIAGRILTDIAGFTPDA